MLESIVTISITGLVAGFIFAMPIAGPISILITSNALNGRLRYSNLISLGASFADFTYIFIAVFGLTKLYTFYKPAIPYMFAAGAVFFVFLGIKIFTTRVNIDKLEMKSHLADKLKIKERGGFYTGLIINFLNPTLFITALTSSFFVISLIASLGFNTGGLELKITENVKEISSIEGKQIQHEPPLSIEQINRLPKYRSNDNEAKQTVFPSYFHLLISLCYAFFLAAGSIAWFHFLAYLIVRYRQHINIKLLSMVIRSLGVFLCILGIYFGYLSARILF